MRSNNIFGTRIFITLIAVYLILLCGNANAQPGYYPGLRMPPYRSVVVPHQPGQSYRQYDDLYIHSDGLQPFISFGIHFEPLISWFSICSYDSSSEGVVPGFIFGISHYRNLSPNYSFSSGIDIINAGGRLINNEITRIELKNYNSTNLTVQPGESIIYRITYLSLPVGMKLRTNQIGYGRIFTDLGLDPKIVIGGRADIPSLNIKGGNALQELNIFNLSFHVMAGMEYPLAANNSLIVGIGYEKNLFDITRDNGDQPSNVVIQKLLSFRLGMTF